MSRFFFVFVIAIFLFGCSDDDTDAEEELIDLPEPEQTYILPETLERRDEMGQTIFSQRLNYTSDIFLSSVDTEQGMRPELTADYRSNFQLNTFQAIDGSNSETFSVTYETERIDLSLQRLDEEVLISYYLDSEGRVDRILRLVTNGNTGGSQTELDREFSYSADFNVVEITDFSTQSPRIPITRSILTFDFVENPFRDTDDVLRLYFYGDYLPNSRYMPTRREDYQIVNGSNVQDRIVNYTYVTDDNGFPVERRVEIDDGSTFPEVYTDFFEYAEVLR